MKVYNLKDFKRGWFCGDFDPSIFKTKDFEIAIHNHEKGYISRKHKHNMVDEINVLCYGQIKLNNVIYN